MLIRLACAAALLCAVQAAVAAPRSIFDDEDPTPIKRPAQPATPDAPAPGPNPGVQPAPPAPRAV